MDQPPKESTIEGSDRQSILKPKLITFDLHLLPKILTAERSSIVLNSIAKVHPNSVAIAQADVAFEGTRSSSSKFKMNVI